MASLSVVTEQELQEMLHPVPHSSNSTEISDRHVPDSVRMIDGKDALRTVSTLDLVCACFYLFFIVCGLLANGWVLHLVINVLRCRESRSTISVPIYILALTFLNIIVLCGLPFTVSDLLTGQWWPKNEIICVTYWIVELMNKTMASFILSLLSISCYFAVCRPKITKMYNNVYASIIFILAGFAITFAMAAPIYKHSGIFYLIKSSNDQSIIVNYGVKCVFQPEDDREQYHFTLFLFACGYAAPAVLMILCYGAILGRVARNTTERASTIPRASISALIATSSTKTNANRGASRFWRVAKSSAILVVFYLCSWTPYWSALLLIMHQKAGTDDQGAQTLASITVVLHVLPYVNCAGSPLLYTLLNRQMRKMYEDSRRRRKSESSTSTVRSRGRSDSTITTRRMSLFTGADGRNRMSLVTLNAMWVRQNEDNGGSTEMSLRVANDKRRKTVCIV